MEVYDLKILQIDEADTFYQITAEMKTVNGQAMILRRRVPKWWLE